jgi:hypothetical protein
VRGAPALRFELELPVAEGYTSSVHELDAGEREDECTDCGLECVCEAVASSPDVYDVGIGGDV